jgi:CHAT domain-containing protein
LHPIYRISLTLLGVLAMAEGNGRYSEFLPLRLSLREAASASRSLTPAISTQANDRLQPGQTIRREITANEKHSYSLSLDAGQYVHLRVMQKAAELMVRVYSPVGALLTSSVRPNRMFGPKPVHVIAQTAGEHRLEITAAPDVKQGSYVVDVVSLRSASSRDRQLIRAYQTFAEALELFNRGNRASRLQAVEKDLAALREFGEAEEGEGEALALTDLGRFNSSLGNNQQALDWYKKALASWRALNDRHGEARTLNNLGVVGVNVGEIQESLGHYQRALALWSEIEDFSGVARTTMNIGVAHSYLGEHQEALNRYREALERWRAIGDSAGEPWPLNNIGLIYASLGDYRQALSYHSQALQLYRAQKDEAGVARVLNDMGEAHAALGNGQSRQQALVCFREALTIRQRIAEKREEAMTLLNMAALNTQSGRSAEAMPLYQQALALARQTQHRWVEAGVLRQMGETLVATRSVEARTLFHSALALYRDLGEKSGEAATLFRLAQLERGQGNATRALAHSEAAIALIESQRVKVASHEMRTAFFASKQDYFEAYIDLLMQLHRKEPGAGYDRTALQVSERARARSLLELLTEARADLRRGVAPELLERARQLQKRLLGKTNRYLELLKEAEARTELAAGQAEINQLTAEYDQVLAEIRIQSPRYADLTQPQPLNLAEIQRQLDQQTVLLQYLLGKERSYLWLVSHDSLESHPLPGRAVIESALRRVYDLATARLPRPGDTEVQQRARLANAKSADRQYWLAATRLSQILLPLAMDKVARKRLVIVPDGALHYVSFGALPSPEKGVAQATQPTTTARENSEPKPLILEHEIALLPSASVLSTQRQEHLDRPTLQKPIVIFADPVFSTADERLTPRSSPPQSIAPAISPRGGINFRRLSFSRSEAREIAAAAPGEALSITDFQASRESALDPQLKQYRVIHFATHAWLNNEQPALSAIVLSLVNEAGASQAGFLQLHDIYNLDWAAEMVVLSACQTALGTEIRGEGIIGLTRGFIYSGAQRVVSSLWSVDDAATHELMKNFYQTMWQQGLSPAAALRQAQITMWRQRRWRAPYFWGAFVLHGEWR